MWNWLDLKSPNDARNVHVGRGCQRADRRTGTRRYATQLGSRRVHLPHSRHAAHVGRGQADSQRWRPGRVASARPIGCVAECSHALRHRDGVSHSRGSSRSGPPDLIVEVAGQPPGGWRVRLPDGAIAAAVDGLPDQRLTRTELLLRPGSHRAVVKYGAS